jgi:hypothetical protein
MRAVLALAAALLIAVLLAACSHGSESSSAGAGDAASSGGASSAASSEAGAAGGAAAAPNKAGGSQSGSSAGASSAAAQQFVRTGTLNLRAKQVAAAADRADAVAVRLGGRVDGDARNAGSSSTGQLATARLVLRIPATRFDQAYALLDTVGTETGRTLSAEDVSSQHADLNARISAAQTSVDRLQTLLAKSGSLGELLQIENQLTAREGSLESLQAQGRGLTDQVALGTLTVAITAPPIPPPAKTVATPSGPRGFGSALARGWHGFVVAARWVGAVLGYVLPTLLIVAALVTAATAAVWSIRRHRRRPTRSV